MSEETAKTPEQPTTAIATQATVPPFFTGLDLARTDQKILLYRCMQSSDHTAEDMVNVPFSIANYVLHSADMVSRTDGELITLERLVLITGDCKLISTASVSIVRGLKLLIPLFGKAPWEPPINVVVKSHPGKGGNKFLTLDIVS